VRDADAVVLGSPIHFATVNAAMIAFISRLWGFRHVTIPIKNKPFALALRKGGRSCRKCIETLMLGIEIRRAQYLSSNSRQLILSCYPSRLNRMQAGF
jgi:multimeric flavodoxin WrbA